MLPVESQGRWLGAYILRGPAPAVPLSQDRRLAAIARRTWPAPPSTARPPTHTTVGSPLLPLGILSLVRAGAIALLGERPEAASFGASWQARLPRPRVGTTRMIYTIADDVLLIVVVTLGHGEKRLTASRSSGRISSCQTAL